MAFDVLFDGMLVFGDSIEVCVFLHIETHNYLASGCGYRYGLDCYRWL